MSYPPLPHTPASAFKCFGKGSNLELSPEGGESFLWGKGGKDISWGDNVCLDLCGLEKLGIVCQVERVCSSGQMVFSRTHADEELGKEGICSSSREGCI